MCKPVKKPHQPEKQDKSGKGAAHCPKTLLTVSYTHLDVYKRQEQIETFRQYVEGKGLTFVPISAATMQGVREPVSYTHLRRS